ncbi:hypothetical protein JCM11754A_36780 [Isoptericola variabilis]
MITPAAHCPEFADEFRTEAARLRAALVPRCNLDCTNLRLCNTTLDQGLRGWRTARLQGRGAQKPPILRRVNNRFWMFRNLVLQP